MIIRELYEDNIYDYMEWLDRDMAENMSRMYFRGIACHDDLDEILKAALIWELKSVETQEATESEIAWIYDDDQEYMDAAFDEYSERVSDDDVSRSFFESKDINKKTEGTLADRGFELTSKESRDLLIPLGEFRSLSILKKNPPKFIHSLELVETTEFNEGMIRILFNKNVSGLEDLCYLPKEWYDQRVSCCVRTDGRINGLLLVHRYPSGTMRPVLFYSSGSDYRHNLLDMMRFSISSALDTYPDDTVVLIRRRNEYITALMTKLFPGKKGEPATMGQRLE